MTTKLYDFCLPVFKQGDDLYDHLKENNGDVAKAFLSLAERYVEAARLCRRVGSVLHETHGCKVDSGSHMISIEGPEERLAGLAQDGILFEVPPEDIDGELWDNTDDDTWNELECICCRDDCLLCMHLLQR